MAYILIESSEDDVVEKVLENVEPEGKVVVQAPDGLKRLARELADELSGRDGVESVVLDAGRVFGACDVTASLVSGADLLVHLGHYPVPSVDGRLESMGLDRVYVPTEGPGIEEWMLEELVEVLRYHGFERFNLCATAQHVVHLGEVASFLEREGFEPRVGEGDPARVSVEGLILGCNTSVLDPELPTVILCSGYFHPAGAALSTGEPVVQLDPTRGVLDPGDVEDVVRRMLSVRLSKTREAVDLDPEDVEVLGSTALGQRRPDVEDALGGVCWRVRYLSEDVLRGVGADACVYCGCPRVPVDEAARFRRWLVLTPAELAAAASGTWHEYTMDAIPTPKGVVEALRRWSGGERS